MENIDIQESWSAFDRAVRNGGHIFPIKPGTFISRRVEPDMKVSIKDALGRRYVTLEEFIELLPQSIIEKIKGRL